MSLSTEDAPTEAIGAVPTGRWARVVAAVRTHRPRTWWVNALLITLLVLAVVAAFLVIGNPGSSTTQVRTVSVSRGTVTATVSGSGNTESSLSTPVSFQTSGTVTAIDVAPGDSVKRGQTLATVDSTSADDQLRTAQAQLDGAKANLAQASSGPTEVKQQQDQLAITQAQQGVTTAQATLAAGTAQRDLDQTSTDTAIANAQQKYTDDKAASDISVQQAQATLDADTATQNANVQSARSTYDTTCRNPMSQVVSDAPTSGSATPTTAAAAPSTSCDSTKAALDTAEATRSAALQKDQLAVDAAQQAQTNTLNTDDQAITNARQAQDSTLAKDDAAVTSDKQAVTTAQNQVTSAQLTAQADQHPETADQIAQVRSTVDSAQVSVDSARRALDETTLTAPQDGVVMVVNGKVGESSGSGGSSATSTSTSSSSSGGGTGATSSGSSSSSGFVTISNPSKLAVTANIAEADAARITLGQTAVVTFPATGKTATGSVTQITPQSTVTNNVVLYPVQVSLDTAPDGVGVGATASLSITTGSKDDVLSVPTSAITTVGDTHTVTVRKGNQDSVVSVQIGLSGDTTTEVTGGVTEGTELVLPTTTPAAASTTRTGTTGTGR